MVIDKQDNVVAAGSTDGQGLKLNPNSNNIIGTGTTSGSSFLIKLDSLGNYIFGNTYNYVSNMTLAIDENNKIISAGNYTNYLPLAITDFNPSPT